jgi:hypothetical protein
MRGSYHRRRGGRRNELGGRGSAPAERSRSPNGSGTGGFPPPDSPCRMPQLSARKGVQMTLIASGGIVSGLDAAKCIALGADIAASARPLLGALHRGGKKGSGHSSKTGQGIRGAMFLTGSARIADLRSAKLVTYPTFAMTRDAFRRRYESIRRRTDRRLLRVRPAPGAARLREGCRYVLDGGGKRVRSVL